MTRPLTLTVNSLKCIAQPMLKRDYCGAEASGSFNRDDFGLSAGKDQGFKMNVDLRIQVEAIARLGAQCVAALSAGEPGASPSMNWKAAWSSRAAPS